MPPTTPVTHSYPDKKLPAIPLRALIEIDGGELRIYPIADNDTDENRILDALRFVREDFER